MMTTNELITAAASAATGDQDDGYEAFLAAVSARFAEVTAAGRPLFTTMSSGSFFAAFLAALPLARRQHYNCRTCARFLDRFGGLVTIGDDGAPSSALWDPARVPPLFHDIVETFEHVVTHSSMRAEVTGVFLSSDAVWGTPSNTSTKPPGEWHHLAVTPPAALVFKATKLETAEQRMAKVREEHGMLARGLAEFPIAAVREANLLLTTGLRAWADPCLGVAAWLLALHEKLAATKREAWRDNLIWQAAATAPAGFAHVRSTMIGTLLEDLVAGLPFEAIRSRFAAKMAPLQYRRPQAPPAAGTIAEAERLVEKLGAASALQRRFATLADVQALWTPRPVAPPAKPGAGVFAHLTPKGARPTTPGVMAPPVTMTWVKFRDAVLPTAERIALRVPTGLAAFAAMVTAADPEALPILQWDRAEKRNPVSWYLYPEGSPAPRWNLTPGSWVEVPALVLQPSMWDAERPMPHLGESLFVLLQGARDTGHERSGGLFPAHLKNELNPIRSVIEAHAKSAPIAGRDEATACGVKLAKEGGGWPVTVRVTGPLGESVYTLDRWD